jgi:hypothetical protein
VQSTYGGIAWSFGYAETPPAMDCNPQAIPPGNSAVGGLQGGLHGGIAWTKLVHVVD